jgi:hypothetical protein
MKTQMVLRAQVSKTRFAAPVAWENSENAKQMVVLEAVRTSPLFSEICRFCGNLSFFMPDVVCRRTNFRCANFFSRLLGTADFWRVPRSHEKRQISDAS